MVDADLQELLADGEDEAAGSDDGGPAPGGAEDFSGSERLDVDDLVITVQGLPAEDAEWEVRDALQKATGQAREAEVLGILLRVFRVARDDAINGYADWADVGSHCDLLTKLCDRGFAATAAGVDPWASECAGQDLPPRVVATVYAECGRTLALAERPRCARERLQKALNVFSMVLSQGNATDVDRRQVAATTASFARVLRRLGGACNDEAAAKEMQSQTLEAYMEALKLYAVLPTGPDFEEFLPELCEFIGQSCGDELSPSLPSLLADIAEDKFGDNSELHLGALRQIADACTDAGHSELGAPALVLRAKALRNRCGFRASAMDRADAEAAEEEAAIALEASLPMLLEDGDLEGAASCWEEALQLRESAEGSESATVVEMRKSLVMLRQAAAGAAADGQEDGLEEPVARPVSAQAAEEAEELAEASVTSHAAVPSAAPVASLSAGYSGASLRPDWSRPVGARTQAANDAWDD